MSNETKEQSRRVIPKAPAGLTHKMSREEKLAAALRANLRRRKKRGSDGQNTPSGTSQTDHLQSEEEK